MALQMLSTSMSQARRDWLLFVLAPVDFHVHDLYCMLASTLRLKAGPGVQGEVLPAERSAAGGPETVSGLILLIMS
jgi:hypothetical protein